MMVNVPFLCAEIVVLLKKKNKTEISLLALNKDFGRGQSNW